MNIILLFSKNLREEEEKLKEIPNLEFQKKFHKNKYGNKFIKKGCTFADLLFFQNVYL
ncbi:MAG: hypothetical protein GTN73_01435 [Candidatus Aminicenantes bacterium]|nr:hypothetical protein [Candidatus Aminicenantes bacterium]